MSGRPSLSMSATTAVPEAEIPASLVTSRKRLPPSFLKILPSQIRSGKPSPSRSANAAGPPPMSPYSLVASRNHSAALVGCAVGRAGTAQNRQRPRGIHLRVVIGTDLRNATLPVGEQIVGVTHSHPL